MQKIKLAFPRNKEVFLIFQDHSAHIQRRIKVPSSIWTVSTSLNRFAGTSKISKLRMGFPPCVVSSSTLPGKVQKQSRNAMVVCGELGLQKEKH